MCNVYVSRDGTMYLSDVCARIRSGLFSFMITLYDMKRYFGWWLSGGTSVLLPGMYQNYVSLDRAYSRAVFKDLAGCSF